MTDSRPSQQIVVEVDLYRFAWPYLLAFLDALAGCEELEIPELQMGLRELTQRLMATQRLVRASRIDPILGIA